MGMTPGAYRRGGAGERIAYTVTDSPLGRLLVAATARGICGISLGDGDEELVAWLRAQYPAAELQPDAEPLGQWVRAVLVFLAGREPSLNLPLDVRGTAFQRQVWAALQTIPYGETRTYSQVAAGLGRPTATRAVARACALNRAALVIPCHRVVGADGSLTGFRWGLERKRRLLEQERTPGRDTQDPA
jgi:AraC family transcriptional regulator of adaptative response/methylated-DNA-[protein]-cysteine methyltransferase